MMKPYFVFILMVLLSGCAVFENGLLTSRVDGPAAGVTAAFATPTPTPLAYMECAWSWATQPLPEFSQPLQTAVDAAGIPQATVTVSAFGENCYGRDGLVNHFAIMETDFDVTVAVTDVADRALLDTYTHTILTLLQAYPNDATPGPMDGRISLTFASPTASASIITPYAAAMTALAQHPTGEGLLEALNVQIVASAP